MILSVGVATLLLGYWCLSRGPEDNPLSLTVAPILLVLGYCVIIPVSIILRDRNGRDK